MKFSMRSYVIAYAMQYLKYQQHSLDYVPAAMKGMKADQLNKILDDVAQKLLELEWHDVGKTITQDRWVNNVMCSLLFIFLYIIVIRFLV
jgi:hypothetical protein